MKQQLLNRYSISSDNDRKFAGANFFDEIAGKELSNKAKTSFRNDRWNYIGK